jgi:signal transduction histidine kinase
VFYAWHMEHIGRIRTSLDRHPRITDSVIALVLGALAILSVRLVWPTAGPETLASERMAIFLVGLLVAPLIWRRRAPLAVLAIMTALLAYYYVLGMPESFWANNAWALALYGAGAYGGERWRNPVRAVAVAVLAGVVARELMWRELHDAAASRLSLMAVGILSTGVILAAVWWFGDVTRIRREREAELVERTLQLDHEREANARRAVLDERMRIARELHDVVAHHVSLMGIQAAAARRVLTRQPATAERSLACIEETSRQAVREMHRLLGFLRQEPEPESRAPQPSMRELGALIDQMRAAGLPVVLTIEGEARSLPPSVDLSAYRIVQEALTNTLKHAGPATAEVTVRYSDQDLEIEISDDGHHDSSLAAHSSSGKGLVGMRERVSLLGGRLQIGANAEAGFAVRAYLPLHGQPA